MISNTILNCLSRSRRALTLVGLCLGVSTVGRADNRFSDEFNYHSGNLLPGATAWFESVASGTTGLPLTIGASSLTYAGLARSDGFNHALIESCTSTVSTGSGQEAEALLSNPISGPDAYYSFLIRVTSVPSLAATGSNSSVVIALHETSAVTNFRGAVSIIQGTTASKFRLGVTQFATGVSSVLTSATGDLDPNTTYFVVIRISKVGTDADKNDVTKIFINPVPGAAEPAATGTYVTGNGGATTETDWPNSATLDGVFIRQRRFAGTYTAQFDAIRVGTTWADVTPAGAVTTSDPYLAAPGKLTFATTASALPTTQSLIMNMFNGGATLPLHIQTGTSVTGVNASHFDVSTGIPQTIAAGGATTGTLTVRFKPGAGISPGLTTATLAIKSDSQGSPITNVGLSIYGTKPLPLYEAFNYNPGPFTAASSGLWFAYSNSGINSIPVLDTVSDSTKSLGYPGMPSKGRRARIGGLGGENEKILFSDQINSGNIYASMLIKVTTATLEKTGASASSAILGFNRQPITGNDASHGILRIITSLPGSGSSGVSATYRLGLSLTSFATVDGDYVSTDLNVATTYFVVIKYSILAGGHNQIVMYINPTWATGVEGAGATQTVTHVWKTGETSFADSDIINGFRINQENFAGGFTAEIDELRVGLGYQDVTNVPPPVTQHINAASDWVAYH